MKQAVFTAMMAAAFFASPLEGYAQQLTGPPAEPQLKYSTPIPAGVATPNKVETSIGTLNLSDGYPDADTVRKIYDNLDQSRALQARLENATIEHAEAILAAYALLQDLQDRGVLDLLRGLTGAGGEIVTAVSAAANTPETVNAIRNIVSLVKILGSIDPGILHDVATIVTETSKPESGATGVWKTLRRLGSRDTRRAIGAAAYGLQVFGRVLISRRAVKE